REYPRQQLFRAPGPLRHAVDRFRLVLGSQLFERRIDFRHALVSPGRTLLQASPDDFLDTLRNVLRDLVERPGLVPQNGLQRGIEGLSAKGSPAADHEIEQRAE